METETRTETVTTAQPAWVRDLRTALRLVSWTAVGVLLTLAVALPDTGWMILNSSS